MEFVGRTRAAKFYKQPMKYLDHMRNINIIQLTIQKRKLYEDSCL